MQNKPGTSAAETNCSGAFLWIEAEMLRQQSSSFVRVYNHEVDSSIEQFEYFGLRGSESSSRSIKSVEGSWHTGFRRSQSNEAKSSCASSWKLEVNQILFISELRKREDTTRKVELFTSIWHIFWPTIIMYELGFSENSIAFSAMGFHIHILF